MMRMNSKVQSKKPVHKQESTKRLFTQNDIDMVLLNIFRLYDQNGDNKFSKKQFPRVLMALGKIIDSPLPSEDECMDIFNLLDTNGDEVIDRQEMRVLLEKFFALLFKSDVKVFVCEEWLIEQRPEELKKLMELNEKSDENNY